MLMEDFFMNKKSLPKYLLKKIGKLKSKVDIDTTYWRRVKTENSYLDQLKNNLNNNGNNVNVKESYNESEKQKEEK